MSAPRAAPVVLVLLGCACADLRHEDLPFDGMVGEVLASDEIFIATQQGNALERHGSTLLLANGETAGFLQVIDSAGQLVRNVGRSGEGPEEFGYVRDIAVAGVDAVWIWDSGNARLARLNADLNFVGTYAVPFRAQNMQGHVLEALSNGDLLLLGCWDSRLNCGVHRWAPAGLRWSFRVPTLDDREAPFVVAHEAEDQSIWVVESLTYQVWQLAADGAVRSEGRVFQPWLDEWSRPVPPPEAPSAAEGERTGQVAIWSPLARVRDIRALPDQVVVIGTTGDPTWLEAQADGFFDVGRYSDGVFDVLDRTDLRVLESVQFHMVAGMPTKFLSDREVLVSETHPVFDRLSIWTLTRNP